MRDAPSSRSTTWSKPTPTPGVETRRTARVTRRRAPRRLADRSSPAPDHPVNDFLVSLPEPDVGEYATQDQVGEVNHRARSPDAQHARAAQREERGDCYPRLGAHHHYPSPPSSLPRQKVAPTTALGFGKLRREARGILWPTKPFKTSSRIKRRPSPYPDEAVAGRRIVLYAWRVARTLSSYEPAFERSPVLQPRDRTRVTRVLPPVLVERFYTVRHAKIA